VTPHRWLFAENGEAAEAAPGRALSSDCVQLREAKRRGHRDPDPSRPLDLPPPTAADLPAQAPDGTPRFPYKKILDYIPNYKIKRYAEEKPHKT